MEEKWKIEKAVRNHNKAKTTPPTKDGVMHHKVHFIPSLVKHNEALIMDDTIPNL